ncbi:MAG: hypothetical protein KJ667_09565, partial [Alphaproteobacteria bacterium]|nr:hypothetical protein [Alphaproteobacteria bacterium]
MQNRPFPRYHHPMTKQPDNNIFTTIRTGFAAVAQSADHVKIRHDLLDAYAATLPPAPPQNLFDPEHHYEGDAEST